MTENTIVSREIPIPVLDHAERSCIGLRAVVDLMCERPSLEGVHPGDLAVLLAILLEPIQLACEG